MARKSSKLAKAIELINSASDLLKEWAEDTEARTAEYEQLLTLKPQLSVIANTLKPDILIPGTPPAENPTQQEAKSRTRRVKKLAETDTGDNTEKSGQGE